MDDFRERNRQAMINRARAQGVPVDPSWLAAADAVKSDRSGSDSPKGSEHAPQEKAQRESNNNSGAFCFAPSPFLV